MNRTELVKRLEVMLDDAAKNRQFGSIEITLQNGEPVMVKETRNTKLYSEGTTHARRFESR
jgi:hypothetical protein